MKQAAPRLTLLMIPLCAVALAACSGHDEASKSVPAPVQSAWLAIARGQVDVEGDMIHIVASRDGRVDAVKVEDGDLVKQGQVLAVLDQRQGEGQ